MSKEEEDKSCLNCRFINVPADEGACAYCTGAYDPTQPYSNWRPQNGKIRNED